MKHCFCRPDDCPNYLVHHPIAQCVSLSSQWKRHVFFPAVTDQSDSRPTTVIWVNKFFWVSVWSRSVPVTKVTSIVRSTLFSRSTPVFHNPGREHNLGHVQIDVDSEVAQIPRRWKTFNPTLSPQCSHKEVTHTKRKKRGFERIHWKRCFLIVFYLGSSKSRVKTQWKQSLLLRWCTALTNSITSWAVHILHLVSLVAEGLPG